MRRSRLFRGKLRYLMLALSGTLVVATAACGDNNNNNQPRDTGRADAGTDAGDVGDVGPGADAGDVGGDAFTGAGALLQLIHESPDPNAQTVDVYVNGQLVANDLKYRSATAFTQVPAGSDLSVSVAPANSTSASDAVAQLGPISLSKGKTYVGIINGVLDSTVLPASATESGNDTQLKLSVLDNARTQSASSGADQSIFFQAVPDAPVLDIVADRTDTVVSNLGYRQFSDYVDFSSGAIHTLDALRARSQKRIDSFQTQQISGGAASVVVASGFIANPTNLPDFRLMAYSPKGGAGTELTQAARLQVVHDSPDPAVDTVDVYVDGELIADNLQYQKATPFLTFPAETSLDVGIAPSNSSSASDAVLSASPTLGSGGSYMAVASGVTDPAKFAPNPAGADTSLSLPIAIVREMAIQDNKVDFKAFHGVINVGPIDILTGAGKTTLVNDLGYGQFTNELHQIDPSIYTLQVVTANQAATPLGTFQVNASQGGSVLHLVASGLANATGGQPPFSLLRVQPDGTVTVLKPSP